MNGEKLVKKGELLEKKWEEILSKKDKKIKNELEQTYLNSDLKDLENLIEKEKKNTLKQNQV